MTGHPSTPDTARFQRRAHSALRSVRLVIISLAVVGISYALYQLSFDPPQEEPQISEISPEQLRFLQSASTGEIEDGGGVMVQGVRVTSEERSGVTILDEALRKKMHIQGRWHQADDSGKRFALENPTITYFLPDGQRAEIRADRGQMTSREKDKIDPQKGTLSGNVRITIDRTTDHWRAENPDLAELPTPLNRKVRFWLEDLRFDLDLGWLASDRDVQIESAQMSLEGQGLVVRWGETAGGFEYLEVKEGRQLTFTGGEQLGADLGSLVRTPPEENVETGAAPDHATLADEAPADVVAEDVLEPAPESDDSNDEAAVAEGLAPDDDEDFIIIDVEDLTERKDPQVFTYTAEFVDDVVARQMMGEVEEGRMAADRLEVLFDLAQGADDEAQGSPGATSDQQPGADQVVPPQVTQQQRRYVHMEWSGPLMITAASNPRPPGEALRRQIEASGRPVDLHSDNGRYTCAKLVHHLQTDFTEFYGAQDIPAVLASGQDSRIAAQRVITLNAKERRAELRGDVHVDHRDFQLRGDVVDAYFGSPAPGATRRTLMDVLDVLECEEQVSLKTANDEMLCKRLTVRFDRDAAGRNLPQHAQAENDVWVRQGTRVLTAKGSMEMTFGDLPRDAEGNITRNSPNLRELLAEDDVRIVDRARDWDMVGDQLACQFDAQQALTYGLLMGHPGQAAQVKLGDYYVEGPTVTFDDARQWAHVPGAGKARVLLTQDLDGRSTDRPVPVDVTWTREMELRGPENVMIVDGQAVATSEQNVLRGDVLRLKLADVEPQPAVELAVAAADPLGMWFLRPYRPEIEKMQGAFGTQSDDGDAIGQRLAKRVTSIIAEGNASLSSVTTAAGSERLESRMTVRGPDIAFDLETKIMLVEGAGVLLIEDYPSDTEVLGRQQLSSSGLFGEVQTQGPSQTIIRWDSSMHYFYAQRLARFEGADEPVWLQHLSGSRVMLSDALTAETRLTPQWLKELQDAGLGRRAELGCDSLTVQFLKSDDRTRGGGQMSLGQLDRFQADGKVILTEDRWRIRADQLVYMDSSELFTVTGLPGQNAYISGFEPDSGRAGEWTGNELHLELKTGRVYAPGGVGRFSGR